MELYYPLILDGATGTQLQKRGYANQESPEEWCLKHPDAIQDIQRAYVSAGSQVVYAPTFTANRVKLEENKLYGQVEDLNIRLVNLSREAVAGRAFVAGDISPTGKFLYPLGDTEFEELVDIYTEQAAALEKAGVDLYVIETSMTMPEARAAVLAIRSLSEKPIFVTFTCNPNGRTLTGTDVTAALVVMQAMGVNAFGLNCSTGPEQMLFHLKRLQQYSVVPLIAKPNAGVPEVEGGKTVYHCPPEEFASYLPAFAEVGVCIFGGCCGTTEEHISAISNTVANLKICRPSPTTEGMLVCATEKDVFVLAPDTQCTTILNCDDTLEDELEDAIDECGELLGIRISAESDLEVLSEQQGSINKPVCFFCEDAALLEQALRLYQGCALYEGSLPESVLEPLFQKYGLIY